VEKGAGREETTTDCGLRSKNELRSAAALLGNAKNVCNLEAQPTEPRKIRQLIERIFIYLRN